MLKSQGRLLTPSILLGTIIWATIVLTASAEPTNCVTAPPGLAGWWAGEGNAQDNLGGNNGALYGSTGFGAGKVGQAFNFDGSSGYVEMPASASLNVGAGAGLTFECWIKPAALADAQPVAEWNSGAHFGLHLWISQPPPYGGGSGSIYVNLVDTAGTVHTLTTGAGILNTNGFQHVALSYDKASGMASLYYNGVLVAAGLLGSFTPQTSFDLYLGKRVSDASSATFHGLIDEASLYSRALTATEIQAIYSADGAGKCSLGTAPSITAQPAGQTVLAGATATFSVVAAGSSPLSYQWRLNGANLSGANGTALTLTNVQLAQGGSYTVQVTNLYGSATSSNAVLTVNPVQSCVPPPPGLVSWWSAEGTAADAVGTNNGVLFGAGFGAGMVGQAFSFDGATQAVFIPYTRSLLTTNYSVEAWVKPLTQVSDSGNQEQIIGQAGGWQLVVRPSASGVSVAFLFATSTGGFPGVVSTSDLPIGQFSHVVGSWDGTTLRLYINGVLNAQVVPGGTPMDSGRELHIGGSRDGSTPVQCFHGLIDEASYYNRALSAAVIQTLYSAGSAGKCQTPVPPSIQASPQNQAIPPGGTVSFMVVAAGTSPLSYQWRFNGAGIAGATSSVLTLTNVQLADVGTYGVTVTNLYGSTNSAGATLTLLGSGACTPPPEGLVSWWTAEGTAADAVGTNNGVLVNGAGFAAGMVGQAFSFDGDTQAVFIPYTRSLLTTNYSVEAWVKPLTQVSDSGNQEQIIGQAGGWQLVVRPGASGVGVAFLFATSTGGFPGVASTSELPIGQFSHVVGSWDGTTLRLFVNGALNAQAVPGGTPVDSGRELHIGGSRDGSSPVQCFHGLIDEASYYNRALSAAVIQTLYSAGSAGKCQTPVSPSIQASPQNQAIPPGGTVSFMVVAAGTSPLSYQWRFNGAGIAGATSSMLTLTNVQLAGVGTYAVTVTNLYGSTNSAGATLTLLGNGACTPVPAGLVSWWTAEGTAADAMGTNNGVLFGAGFGAGMVGQAFSFDGATQAVFIPYTRSLLTTNYSAEAWVKPLTQVSDPGNQEQIMGQAGGWQLVVRPGASGVSVAFLFATSTGSFPGVVSTSELPIGQFSHVVGSWDGTTLRLYINGVLSAQSVPGATPVDSGRELHIGGSRDGSTPVQCFHGLIDEASYYNRALSAAEIQTLFAAGSMGKCQTQVPPSVQTYQFSMPISGAITLGALDWGNWTTTTCTNRIVVDSSCASVLNFCGVLLNFQSLTETVVFDPVNLTLRQFGIISVTPSASQFLIHEYDPSSPSRTGDIAIQYSSLPPGLSFDTGARPLTYDAIRKVYTCDGSLIPEPVTIRGSYSIVTSNETRSGTIDYALSRYPSPYADIFVTFNTISLSNYPASLSLSGAGEGDPCSPPGFIASPQLITDFTATNGFHALLYAGGVNWFGNKAEEGVWAVGPVTATNAGPVVPPIVITVQPQDQTVGVGSNATFGVAASGSGPLSYQWYFNGAALSGATSTSLVLSGVSLSQAGSYGVMVSNAVGSVNSRSALLVVLGNGACTPPPAGLVSWWAAEGLAADIVGTNNGVLFGAGFGAGEVGQAFTFDGATQAVFIPYTRSLLTTNYSVEAWVKPLTQVSDPGNQEQIMGQAGGWQLVVRPGASGVSVVFLFATSTGSFPGVVSTSELPIGQFSHVVGSWDGTTLRLYINGVLNAQAVPGRAPVDSGRELHIGGSRDGSTPVQCFHGLIDEASYYNRALSAAEVQTLYNAGSAGKCQTPVQPSIQASPQNQAVPPGGTASFIVVAAGTDPLSYQWHFNGAGIAGATSSVLTLTSVQLASVGTYAVTVTNLYGSTNSAGAILTLLGSGACTPAPSGLVGWWTAEGTAADVVGTNNGVLFGAGFGAGMVGQGFSFDGATQAVFIPYTRSLLTTNYSAEAWVKPLTQVSDPINQEQIIGQAGGWQLVVRPGASGVSVAFLFATAKGSFPGVVSTSELPIGQYSHVVGSWDGTTLRLYINGALNAQAVPGAAPVDSGRELHIGGSRDGSTPVQCFHGLIDEASYYSRALSASEIQAIYYAGDAGKCPVGVAPSVLTQPAGQAVSAGGNAAFSVTVAGTPPLSYQWQFSGTNIPGATGTSLTLNNVQSAQAGSYTVRVTNVFGSIMSSNALLSVISSPTCAPPPSGLVSWWRAEGSAGDGVASNHGALLNGASFASGMVGQALSFNGSYQCVQVPHAASLVASNYSIEAWVKPLAQVSDPIDQDLIFGQSFGHCQLVARTGSTGVRLAFSFGTSHTSFYEATGTSEIPIGRFSHLAGTWDGTTLRLYINGVLNAQSTPHAAPVDSGCPFYLGGFYSPTADSCGYVGQFFDGLIDEASYYNRALSGAEIQAIYSAGSLGKCRLGVAPTIIRQPASLAVHAGATAVFSVTAAGTPPLSFQWQFKGTNIAGAIGTSLRLTNVQPVQAGSYAVRVTNPFGSIMSSNALLMVNRMRLQVGLNPDGTTRLHFLGNNSQSYRIEVSPDMLNWVSLGICTADAEGNVEFTDPNVAKQPLGFYRAVEQ